MLWILSKIIPRKEVLFLRKSEAEFALTNLNTFGPSSFIIIKIKFFNYEKTNVPKNFKLQIYWCQCEILLLHVTELTTVCCAGRSSRSCVTFRRTRCTNPVARIRLVHRLRTFLTFGSISIGELSGWANCKTITSGDMRPRKRKIGPCPFRSWNDGNDCI